MFKTMKKEKKLDEFLVNLYPETHDKFTAIVLSKNTLNFIGKGPRLQRYNLLNTSFKQKYNRDLLDYPDYFTEDLLKITPLKEREHILDHKVKENEKLYYLYGTASSVPEFKQRLQHSSKLTRQEYANAILETCFANEDKDALLEVLRYLTNRYRNDIGVLQVILDRCRDKHSVRHFSADHWECLLNALKTCQLRYHYWGTDNLYESYIAYLITNGKSIDNVIKDIVKTMAETQRSGYVFIQNKRFRKMYCDKIANYIDTFKDHDRYKYMAQQFLYIASQQYKLKKNELLEYNRFFDQLSVDDWTSEIVVRLAVKLNDEVIHRLFWSSNNVKSNEGVIWYARNRPDKLNENVDRVIKKCGDHKLGKFLHRLNRFIEENLREEIKAHALNVVNNENSEDMKVSIIALSALSPETFLELVPSAFPPDDGKIDLEESTDKINAQRAFVNSLRYTQNSPKAFSLVLKFCIGDYLKFALPSLYSLSYNAKELSLKEYLDGLFDTAVSVRKHFLLLGRHLFPLDAFCNILHGWSEGEKNFSMRNILLRKTVEYLIENPLESLWSLFKANLQSLDPDDRGIYDYLLKFQDISLEYMPEYIELVYKAIAANPDSIVNEKKFELVNNIPSGLVRRLNFEFLKQLVSELACSKSASIFHWQCIFLLDEMKRLELFEENFAKLKTNRVALEQDVSAKYQISNFVLYFVQSAIKFKSDGELIDRFISYWSSMFQPENFNTDFMLIQFTNLLFKSDFDAYQSGVHTNTLLYEYIHKYNASIIDLFCRRLRFFLSLTPFEKEENDMLKFVDGFFNNKLDEHIYIAVMYLLPKTLPTYENAYAKYMPVWEALQRHESPASKVRQRGNCSQPSEFDRGRFVGLDKGGFSFREIANCLNRNYSTITRCSQSWTREGQENRRRRIGGRNKDRSAILSTTSCVAIYGSTPTAVFEVVKVAYMKWHRVVFGSDTRFCTRNVALFNFMLKETFPQTEQFALVSSIFKEKYGQNLLDNPEYCKKCLQIIPVQQREPILDILVKDDEELIYFYNPTRSIPTLKSKLQHCADSQERGRLTSLIPGKIRCSKLAENR
ncbi:hypothetical protein Trydic_g7551 [Trypoxylus dichotomus]